MSEHLLLLLMVSSANDELSIVNELHKGGFEVSHKCVETAADFQVELESKNWDLIICDYSLRVYDAMATLALHQEMGLDTPFIVLSAEIGEDLAVDVLKAGATDFVVKRNLGRLVPAVNRELRAADERRIRRRAESTKAFLASLVESCNDAIIGQTLDGTIVTWNGGAEQLYGYTASEMLGRSVSVLTPTYRPEELPQRFEKLIQGESVQDFETVRIRKDGTALEVALTISPVKDSNGRVIGASTVERDNTRRKQDENERLGLIQDLTSAVAIKIRHLEPIHMYGHRARNGALR